MVRLWCVCMRACMCHCGVWYRQQWYPGSRGPNVEKDSKRKKEGPLASAVENLASMLVFGSDFEVCL